MSTKQQRILVRFVFKVTWFKRENIIHNVKKAIGPNPSKQKVKLQIPSPLKAERKSKMEKLNVTVPFISIPLFVCVSH